MKIWIGRGEHDAITDLDRENVFDAIKVCIA